MKLTEEVVDLEVQTKQITCNNIKKDLYLITSDGKIWSNYLKNFMSAKIDKDGYLTIGLRTDENKQKMFRIHQLVMLTYGEAAPRDMIDPTINHINGDKKDNRISNLEWMSRSKNSSMRAIKPIGEKNGASVLKEKEVLEIIDLLKNTNLSLREIGDKYGIHKTTVLKIKQGKTWKKINPFSTDKS